MPCNIIVGEQYRSEGKGKIVALLAKELDQPYVVRCETQTLNIRLRFVVRKTGIPVVYAGTGFRTDDVVKTPLIV